MNQEHRRARPNLVLICIDDLGAFDLGCTGSTFYETPNIDRLAASGMTFDAAYAGSCMCSPSRASLMTGQTPPRVGVTNWIGAPSAAGPLDAVGFEGGLPQIRTLPEALRDGGYVTWHVGKWHLGSGESAPSRRGFDEVFAGSNVGGPTRHFSPYLTKGVPNGRRGEYLTDRLTDEAIALVRRRPRDQPFFLNLWHFAVHTPIQAPQPLVRRFIAKRRSVGLGQSLSGIEDVDTTGATGFGRVPDLVLMRRRSQSDPEFAAMIANLDHNIGRLVGALADEGIERDTLVIFTSDNGGVSSAFHFVPPGCNAPLAEGKGWTFEGGVRVPLLASWPGRVAPATTCSRPVIGMDVMPTLLAAAGLPLEPEAHVDGRSLLGLLDGRDDDGAWRDRDLCWHYPHYQGHGGRPAASLRRGRWKLVRFFEDPAPQLFDLELDPGEERDVAGDHRDLVADLAARLDRWLRDVGAAIPQANPRWDPPKGRRQRAVRRVAERGTQAMLRRHERRLSRRAGPVP